MENQTHNGAALPSHDLLAVLRSRIDECENEENRLDELLLEKRAERGKLQLEAIAIEFGVIVGSIVTGRDGLEYRVTSISPAWKTPWLKGNPRKKDGTWGIAERHLYGDWKVSSANVQGDGSPDEKSNPIK
jgi:hypothetical protein